MIKRMFFMVVLAMCVLTSTAQVANRSGVFVEAGVGGLMGNTMIDESKSSISNGQEVIKTKTGVSYDAMVGYRWAFSRNWALDGRVGFDNPGKWTMDIMPGIRYTTDDFIAGKSLFFQANAGISLVLENLDYELGMVSPALQLQAGINITSQLYAGIYYFGHFMHYNWWTLDNLGFDRSRIFGTFGIRLGYRF